MVDFKAELERKVRALYQIALEFISEEEARALFCSVTKRGRGKRGPSRILDPSPNKDAERKRRAREPLITFEIERPLTEEDIRRSDKYFLGRMDSISDKR
jgi:hypothetical protein